MCFRGSSASPSTSGDDSSSTMDETMASARKGREAMGDGGVTRSARPVSRGSKPKASLARRSLLSITSPFMRG